MVDSTMLVPSVKKSVTIQDVARAAGVGVGTVSRVINREANKRSPKVRRVLQAIEELHYQAPQRGRPRRTPKTEANAFRPGDSFLLVLRGGGLQWILNHAPVYARALHGIEETLSKADLNLVIRQIEDIRDVPGIARQNEAKGVLLFLHHADAHFDSTIGNLTAVRIFGSGSSAVCDHLEIDHQAAGEMLANHLWQRGHRCCAFIGPEAARLTDASFTRREAFVSRLAAEASLLVLTTPGLIMRGPEINAVDEAHLGMLLDRFCAAKPRPTALFCDTDIIVPGVYRGLQQRGIAPGRDVEVVGCNNDQIYLAGLAPMPTTADVRAVELGRTSAERLLWRISHPADPIVTLKIYPRLVIPPAEAANPILAEPSPQRRFIQ